MKYAHKLDRNSNLFKKNLIGHEFYNGENLIKNLALEKSKINKLKIYFGDGEFEDFKITTFKENTYGIIDFFFESANSELIVHPNSLISDKKIALFSNLITILKNTNLSDNKIYDTQNVYVIPNVPIKEQLFIDNHEQEIKNNLENIITSIANNIDIFDLNDNKFLEIYKKDLEKEKNAIYIGLNYLYRWYSISNFRDKLLYSLAIYGKSSDSLSLLKDIGKLDFANLKADKTANGYHEVFSKYLNPSSPGNFIEYNYNLFKQKQQNIDDFFKSLTKAYITKIDSKSDQLVNKPMIERFKQEEQADKLLPLLTVKDENALWFIHTTNSNISGVFSRYRSSSFSDEKIKEQIKIFGESAQDYYDVLYRILNQKSKKTMQNYIVDVYDAFGGKNDPGIKSYALPINAWRTHRGGQRAYMPTENRKAVYFVASDFLSYATQPILVHEHTHNFDDDILLDGYGKRRGHNAESYATGMFQAPSYASSDELAFNFIKKYSGDEKVHNSSPERFANLADLENYYKNLFDLIYVLDLAEAKAIIAKKSTENYQKLELSKDDYAKKDILNNLQNSDFNSISSINDLVDRNIVGSRVGGSWKREFGHNNYITVNLFKPYFGLLENKEGISGGLSFRRTAFELLAEKGYYVGMVPYISAKSNQEINVPEGVVKGSDSHVLRMIFGDKYKSFSDFKKDMYKKREEKLNKLKPFSFTYRNQTKQINTFEDLEKIFIENFTNTTELRTRIHVAIHKKTDEHRESIFNS